MNTYGTVNGTPITDQTIAAMTANAEDGFPGTTMTRHTGRPPLGTGPARTVAVRLDPALQARQHETGKTTSQLIRDALTAYLPAA